MGRRSQKVSFAPHPRIEELSRLALEHPDRFVKHLMKVEEDGSGRPIKWEDRWEQNRAYEIFREEWDAAKPVRIKFLKSRRKGLTSLFAGVGIAQAMFREHFRMGIIAHNEFRSKQILKMCKFFHKTLPDGVRFPLSRDSSDGIEFLHNGSELMIGTCNEPDKVRGGGCPWFHLSEPAHYGRMYRTTMLETCTTLAPEPYTVAIWETTGKGRGSAAHKDWQASKTGENIWRAEFLAQQNNPNCVLPFDSDRQRAIILDEIAYIEPRLIEKYRFYKLTPEQMHYFYLKDYILRCHQDYEYYCREFPFDEEEAWDSHGLSFFGDNEIATMATRVEEPLYFSFSGRFINSRFHAFSDLQLLRRGPDDEQGALVIKLWDMPVPGRQYVIGADSSLGERGGTYTSGYVCDLESRKMMCAYRGRIRPDEHAFIMASLGWIYNEAIVGPEVNPGGGGMEVLNNLQRIGYTRFYIWRLRDDKRGIILSQRLGWVTNTMTRPIMLNELRRMFTDCAHERFPDPGMFRDRRFITEARTFQKDTDTGRIEAADESYDDCIIALGITHRICADEVFGGTLDLYASYEEQNKKKGPFADLLEHYDKIADGHDPCDVVNFLTSTDFNLKGNGIEWLE